MKWALRQAFVHYYDVYQSETASRAIHQE